MGPWSCEVKWKSWEQCYLYLHCWLLLRGDANSYNICTWPSTEPPSHQMFSNFCEKRKKYFCLFSKMSWPLKLVDSQCASKTNSDEDQLWCFCLFGAILSRMLPWMWKAHEAGGRSAGLSGSENSISVWTVLWPRVSEHLTLSMTASPSVVENKGAFAFSAQPLC